MAGETEAPPQIFRHEIISESVCAWDGTSSQMGQRERQIGREEGEREGKRHSSGDLDIFGHNKSKQRDSQSGD